MSRKNLEKILDQANYDDLATAKASWFRYHDLCREIARNNGGFSVKVGAGVFAALSPNNDYVGNVRDTRKLLAGVAAGRTCEQIKVSTYNANKWKAVEIANGKPPLDLILAQKTRNFYLNVIDPLEPQPVTVDGHILNAWSGKRIALHSAVRAVRIKTSKQHYEDVAQDIRDIGRDREIIPNVVQSAIWQCWKRIHGIKVNGQFCFWPDDYIGAGLGFRRETITMA